MSKYYFHATLPAVKIQPEANIVALEVEGTRQIVAVIAL